jgi:hypothetical protein
MDNKWTDALLYEIIHSALGRLRADHARESLLYITEVVLKGFSRFCIELLE